MKMRIAVLAATVPIASSAWADTWTSAVTISALQPLVDQEGGVVRVYLTSNISTSCGNTNIFDFVFTNGVAAANSALVAVIGRPFRHYRLGNPSNHSYMCSSNPKLKDIPSINANGKCCGWTHSHSSVVRRPSKATPLSTTRTTGARRDRKR
jgi:hypothetical protein